MGVAAHTHAHLRVVIVDRDQRLKRPQRTIALLPQQWCAAPTTQGPRCGSYLPLAGLALGAHKALCGVEDVAPKLCRAVEVLRSNPTNAAHAQSEVEHALWWWQPLTAATSVRFNRVASTDTQWSSKEKSSVREGLSGEYPI